MGAPAPLLMSNSKAEAPAGSFQNGSYAVAESSVILLKPPLHRYRYAYYRERGVQQNVRLVSGPLTSVLSSTEVLPTSSPFQ